MSAPLRVDTTTSSRYDPPLHSEAFRRVGPANLRIGSNAIYELSECLGSGVMQDLVNQVGINERGRLHAAYSVDQTIEVVRMSSILPSSVKFREGRMFHTDYSFEQGFDATHVRDGITAEFTWPLAHVNLYPSTIILSDNSKFEKKQKTALHTVTRQAQNPFPGVVEKRWKQLKFSPFTMLYALANQAGEAVLANDVAKPYVPLLVEGEYIPTKPEPLDERIAKWIGLQRAPEPALWIVQEQLRRVLLNDSVLSEQDIGLLCEQLNRERRDAR